MGSEKSINEEDLPTQINKLGQEEDYADAKLIEEMMDMDPNKFMQLSKQKREVEREKTKGEEENKKGEASKKDADVKCDEGVVKSSGCIIKVSSDLFASVREKIDKGDFNSDELKGFTVITGGGSKKKEKKEDCPLFRPEDGYDVRNCLGSPYACSNCESKGITDKPSDASAEPLKRCGGCYLVAYCSERCQKEHWINNHQNMCKILSGRKYIGVQKHISKSCENCKGSLDFILKEKHSYSMPCALDATQCYLLNQYWLHFGYHKEALCNCSLETKLRRVKNAEFPMQSPFSMGEISGEYLGWIDQYLAKLSSYIVAVEQKYEKQIQSLGIRPSMTEIAMFIAGNRASYWYFVTNEKNRAMSEVLFTQKMHTKSMKTRYVDNSINHLYEVDKAFKAIEEGNVWWETFLHHFAQFYRRLRRTRYLLFNTESIPKHKKKELVFFEDLHESAIMNLSRPVETLIPQKTWANLHGALDPGFLVSLPTGTKCHICAVEIGDRKAQLQLQLPVDQNIWNVDNSETIEEKMLIRFPKLPIIFEEEYKRGLIATCGVNTNCNTKAFKLQLEVYKQFAKANLCFLFNSQKCEGCMKFSCETHRCSGCRSVRYCSQDCLVDDWKVHQAYCKVSADNNTEDEKTEKTIGCRKLEGDERIAHYDQCVEWLGKCDTIVKLCFFNWHIQGIGVEQLLNAEPSKKRKKKKEVSKPSADGEVEEMRAKDNEPAQEITATVKESEPVEVTSHSRVKLISCGSILSKDMAAKLSSLFENDGVKVSVLSLDDNGKDFNLKPIISDDKDGKSTVHMENIPKNNRIKNTGIDAQTEETVAQIRNLAFESDDESEESDETSTKIHSGKEQKNKEECIVKPENLEKVTKIVQQHRRCSVFRKEFKICHVKNQKWLNEKICQVVDVEPKNGNLFDPRVVCKLNDEDKQFSLKQTNLVDIRANIDAIFGTNCIKGHMYRKSTKNLSNTFVNKLLKKIVSWAREENQTRPDQVHRLALLKKYMAGDITEIGCKDNPEYDGLNHNEWTLSESEFFSACLSAVRPGCVGDNFVHFNRFNQLTCECDEERLDKRFREFVVTGMCHTCQAYYIERPNVDNPQCFGSIFVKCSRVKSLDGLQLTTA